MSQNSRYEDKEYRKTGAQGSRNAAGSRNRGGSAGSSGNRSRGGSANGSSGQRARRPDEREVRARAAALKAKKKRRARNIKILITTAAILGLTFSIVMAVVVVKNSGNGGGGQHITLTLPGNSGQTQAAPSGPQYVGNRDYGVQLPSTFQNPPAFERSLKLTGDAQLDRANRLAAMYDYDAAIAAIRAIPGYESSAAYTKALASYEEAQAMVMKWPDNYTITHIFFHTLIVDPAKTFDVSLSSADQVRAYNSAMTTVDEFVKIIQTMYDKGYVLVGLHDVAEMAQAPDGSVQMTMKPIYLPEGKTPFILSEDDVCYYEYMTGQGFPTRFVIGEDGRVTNEYRLDDGTVIRGSFDVMPILEDFIEAHPDFSYRGAKGTLAVTGYNGIWGYRTSDFWYNWNCPYFDASKTDERARLYFNNENIEADKRAAAAVSEAIKAQGWTIASHSWGHVDVGAASYERIVWDADMWEREVKPLTGDTDIIIFAFGAELDGWQGYAADNVKYLYLKSKGFNYYCNVDASTEHWVQIGANKDYFRQARRNLDGYRLWEAVESFTNAERKNRLGDLFDARDIFDKSRPTPVLK